MKKLHNSLTIRMKLIIAIVLLLLVPSVSIGLISYHSAKTEMENSMFQTAHESVQLINTSLINQLDPIKGDVDYFAKTAKTAYASINSEDVETIKQRFNQYIKTKQEAQAIYIGFETGDLIISPPAELPEDFDPRERPWYKLAMENKGEVVITDPYIDVNTNEASVTFAKVLDDGSGVVGIDINITALGELTSQVKIGEKGYITIIDNTKSYIVHPTDQGEEATGDWVKTLFESENDRFSYTFNGSSKVMDFMTNELTGWKIAGTMYSSEIDHAAQEIFNKTIIVIVVSLLLGGFVIFCIIKFILNPIRSLVISADRISNGDLTEEISSDSNDEVGMLTKSFKNMVDNLRTVIMNLQSASERVSSSSVELIASADQTTIGTKQVTEVMQQVAVGAENQTTQLEANTQALEEVLQGVLLIAGSSSNVSEMAHETMKEAEIGAKFVKDNLEQMKFIHESVTESNKVIRSLSNRSKEIGKILDVISDIAAQTNLLALNAAIEAARAGEHGRGFAVVADEVRKLAEQSQESAGQISTIISSIQQDTTKSVDIMNDVSKNAKDGLAISTETSEKFDAIMISMNAMTPQIEEVSATVQQMSAAIQEVSASANEITIIAKESSTTSEEVAATTEQQLASMEEITLAAKSLTIMAEELQALIEKFKV
jgi:methyl-accepting chemotaxis protein